MHRNVKMKVAKQICLVLMSFAMVISLVSTSILPVVATTSQYGNAITISVTDKAGIALSGAMVSVSVETDISLKKMTETTDENGVVVVMNADEYERYKADNLHVNAIISKEGYVIDRKTIQNTKLTSATQNLSVVLTSSQMDDIKVKATSEHYNGQSFDAATISGTQNTDKVTYKLDNGNWTEVMPKISDVGAYSLTVKVKREGYDDFVETVYPKIEKGNIQLEVKALEREYDGTASDALEISNGLESGDTITYVMNGQKTTTVPQIQNVGEYEITVKVKRNEKYNDFSKTYTAKITQKSVENLSATFNSWVYDGNSHPVINEIVGKQDGDIVKYQLNDGPQTEDMPTVSEVGIYAVKVDVIRDGNTIELNTGNVFVKPASQVIEFSSDTVSETVTGEISDAGETYDLSANNKTSDGGTLTYSIENTVDNEGIASIDQSTGELTVYMPGTVTVVATASSTNHYVETSKKITFTIKQEREHEGQFINFAKNSDNYIFGENNGIISAQTVSYTATKRKSEISYEVDNKNIGIKSNSLGEIAINDYKKLGEALIKNKGKIQIKVTATMKKQDWFLEDDQATYEMTIGFAQTPAQPYVINGTKGQNDWYTSAIVVKASDSTYQITDDLNNAFASSVTFNDQGTKERYVYLKSSTGGITDRILLDGVKIDTVKPDSHKIQIDYSKSLLSQIFWFYDGPVTANFTAYDESSGIESFAWEYHRSADASTSQLEKDDGTVTAKQNANDSTKYTASITLPKDSADQLRGYMTVRATDKAGLVSDDKKDNDRGIVVDTISPTKSVSYGLEDPNENAQDIGDKHYYSGNVVMNFHITEANFYADDVVIKVSKDKGEAKAVSVAWNKTSTQDEYEATYVLSGDGDYVVTMEYQDRSGHKMDNYKSEEIIIDTTAPVITFNYSNANNTSANKDNKQTATITVKEQNFRASDLEVVSTAQDINGQNVDIKDIQEALKNAKWSHNGDVHTATLSDIFVDGIYDMTLNYKDLALNPATEVESGQFIVDHTAPQTSSMKVNYSTPILERIISAMTFGFYNPSVQVTFTANDMTSGIDHFEWSYLKESGASDSNVDQYQSTQLQAVQDTTDKSQFTASVTLPKASKDQLRGNISFVAVDKYGNASQELTDKGHVIVVDTISPTMTAKYNGVSRTVGQKMYSNQDMTAMFTVTEANFYSQDVIVEVSKNGGQFQRVSPTWRNVSADTHIGTYTFKALSNHSNDADYVVRVRYTDRSHNQMATYTSGTMTIDTIKPVIDVSYSNQNIKNTLNDLEGHRRNYFDSSQTATITITEHNFDPQGVKYTIIAKDAAGNELNADNFITKSSWTTSGDKHVMTITYSGDANYTFDVAYTDFATNTSADYKEDYFTVDQTAPQNMTVSYSDSILDTILQSITFGFYKSKATVTIQANDDISGVHNFEYSCLLAEGVSSVNAEFINQAIQEAKISYSKGRTQATAQFSIPRDALDSNHQFNGHIIFTATDRAGNKSSQLNDNKRIVVDNISPTAQVEYSSPVQTVNGISYYDGAVNATVTIREANFYASDVQVSVSKDGSTYSLTPSWSHNGTDIHIGTFTLTDDGDYFITINYTDKSSNQMETYTSEQLTIDTEIQEPVITVNGEEADGKAFKDDVVPAVSFEDVNFENYEITLTRSRYDDKNADVKDQFINGVSVDNQGGTGSFDTFKKEQDVDGIYTMTVSMTDKAGHSTEKTATFTVNRFGSVYEYNDYLSSLVKDGGAYVQEVQNDLVITEYNADRLVSDSLNVDVSCDGKPLADLSYRVTPQINNQVSVGNSGWYEYQYTISKDNFASDGVYKIAISSQDETGNTPENTNYEDKNILFRVDSTAPEIDSITGLEDSIINAQNVTSKYTVYDTIGLASVDVYVDGKNIDSITHFDDLNNYAGSFVISEKNSAQKVRLVIRDLAGNITDTDSDDFESAFAFQKSITVSTNFFVRFYANKLLFWGSIGSIVAIGVAITAVIDRKRKKGEISKED